MKNIDRLIGLYRDDARTDTIIQALDAPMPARLQLRGTAGAQDAFVLAGTYLASPRRMPFNEDGIFRRYPELDPA